MPGYALVTAYHVVWAAILLRLAVAETMGEEHCYKGKYGPSTRSVIGSVLDIMAAIEWVEVDRGQAREEALRLEEVRERI